MSGCTFIASTLRAIPLAFQQLRGGVGGHRHHAAIRRQPAQRLFAHRPRPSDQNQIPGAMLPNRYGIAIIQCQCGTVTTQKIVIGRRCGGAH